MTNSQARELNLKLDFLGEGNYEAVICEDGVNADRYPSDYNISKKNVEKNSTINIKMAPGGGWVMRLTRK
jgi:alpha-glucosidase